MKRNYMYMLLALMVSAGCSDNIRENGSVNGFYVNDDPKAARITASSAEEEVDAKSSMGSVNDKKSPVSWTAGDRISVHQISGEAYNNIAFTTPQAGSSVYFVEDVTGTFVSGEDFYGIYPYSADNSVMVADETVTLTAEIPAVQTATHGTFAEEANVAVGKSDADGNIQFKNVCTYLRLSVTNGDKVKSVTVTGNKDEYIAGKVNITFNGNGEPVATPIEGESVKSVKLECANQTGFVKGQAYYIAIIPQSYKEGITLTIETVENTLKVKDTSLPRVASVSQVTNNELNLGRNKVRRLFYWDDRIEWRSAMLFDFENKTIGNFWASSTTDLIAATGSESNCYKVVANPKTNTINPSGKVLMFDSSLAGNDDKINSKQFYKGKDYVENARFAFTPTTTDTWSNKFTGVRMKIYIREADKDKYFPRCQISYTKAKISGTETIINRPIMTPRYLNGKKLDVKWISYVDNTKETTDLAGESINNIDATYNEINQDWLDAWSAAIKGDDWNDFVFDYRNLTGSNIPAHSTAYICRIHPFFPAKISSTGNSDMYHADEYGQIYIDDIEYVEFYGAH